MNTATCAPSESWGLLDPAEARAALGTSVPGLAAGVVVLDACAAVRYANPAAARLLGADAASLLERPLPVDGGKTLAARLRAGEPLRLLAGPEGGRFVLLASPTPLALNGAAWLLTLQDISDEHAAQERLARQAALWGQRNVHLALLQRPTLDIAAQPDLATTLQAIVYRAARLIDAHGSAIVLRDEAGALRRAAAWDVASGYDAQGAAIPAEVVARALESGEPQRCDACAATGALIVIPLRYRDISSGLLAAFRNGGAAQPFSEDDELLLAAIAAQAALAIGNARLYDETRDSLAQRETMTELLEAINSQLELQPLLDRIIEGAARLFDVEVGIISLWDPIQGTAYVAASYDLPELLGMTITPGGLGITGEVLLRGEPVIVNDHYRDVRGAHLLHLPIDHALGAPIQWQGRMIGVFMLGSRRRRFGPRDIQPLTLFAKHAAIAIEKARLFDETRSLARALRSSETRLRAIIDNMPALVYLADPTQGVLIANQQFADLVGAPTPEAMIGKMTDELFAPEDAAALSANNMHVLTQGAKVVLEETIGQGAATRYYLSIKFPVRDADSGAIQLGGVSVDITERKHDEERLRQLAALEERAKLARELHDSVTQTLFSMSLNARAAERALHINPEQAASTVAELRRLAQGALAEMRALIFELRPESLENEGLLGALAKHTAAVQARHELSVTVDSDYEPAIDIAAKEAFYRIAQEALHNVVKHAHAAHVGLTLRHEEGAFVLRVQDDGRGFDASASFPGHLGLTSMRERAARIGATLTIESRAGAGTRVTAQLHI